MVSANGSSRFMALKAGVDTEWFLHYVDTQRDPGDERDAVVMVHGNPTWSFYFRHIIAKFQSTHRMIALDHLGSGLSGRPQDFSYRLADHGANFAAFMDHLAISKPITLVVHDWGGAIGMYWAVKHPEKIKRLVILNTAAFNSKMIPKRIAFLRIPWLGEVLMRGLNIFALAATRMAVRKPLSREAKAGLLAPYDSWRNRLGIARFVQDIPLTSRHPTYKTLQEIESGLPKLTCPTLLLWGMRDFCFHPGFLAKWQTIYPKAHVICLAEAGHYLLEDAPEEVNNILSSFFDLHP